MLFRLVVPSFYYGLIWNWALHGYIKSMPCVVSQHPFPHLPSLVSSKWPLVLLRTGPLHLQELWKSTFMVTTPTSLSAMETRQVLALSSVTLKVRWSCSRSVLSLASPRWESTLGYVFSSSSCGSPGLQRYQTQNWQLPSLHDYQALPRWRCSFSLWHHWSTRHFNPWWK